MFSMRKLLGAVGTASVATASAAVDTTATSVASACPLAYTTNGPPFSADEIAKVRSYFLKNIDVVGSGAVVAAPDNNTGVAGSYFYHWMRDGALSMNALMHTSDSLDDVEVPFGHYVSWVEKVQAQSDPNNIDVRSDPKFEIPSGVPFTGGWCRPQSDGPGLRAKTLAEYALKRLERDAPGDREFVREHLWTGSDSRKHGGTVKYDLDWVAANWRLETCDLWEDLRADDLFWNRYVQRAGLVMGARLAEKFGDVVAAVTYRAAAAEIAAVLPSSYNGQYVIESKLRLKDGAVIEAFNDGYLGDAQFHPLSKEVLGTVVTLNDFFCSTYAINQLDTAAKLPGILYGRYEGDVYHDGNPWVLLSATFAQLIYRQALAVLTADSVEDSIYALLQQAYGVPAGLSGAELGNALLGSADGVMLRIRHHVQPEDFHMAEQISRADGSMVSAKDLTWNYANILKAMHARAAYTAMAATRKPDVLV